MSACGICTHDDQEALEELGLEAKNGKRSWSSAAREAGLTHHVSLKNHMLKHWEEPIPESDVVLDELDPAIATAMRELQEAMEYAPVEVKPLYAIAIRNLKGLLQTKPSQSNLITALKAIHEITGMKMEQKLMLGFAARMFPGQNATAAIEKGQEYIEAEVVE